MPVYRSRDARRGRNAERIGECAAVYLGGGVPDHLLEAIEGTPIADALLEKLRDGGVVVAIAAAAQCVGARARGVFAGTPLPGLGWLPQGVVETNFDPEHDRRLRKLLALPEISWGLGIPAGSAVLLGPGGVVEAVGVSFVVRGADGDLVPFGEAGVVLRRRLTSPGAFDAGRGAFAPRVSPLKHGRAHRGGCTARPRLDIPLLGYGPAVRVRDRGAGLPPFPNERTH